MDASLDHMESVVGSSSCLHVCAENLDKCSSCGGEAILSSQEASFRKSYSTFLQKLGQQLKLPQVTIATAIVLCHRFFSCQSPVKNDRFVIAAVCIFLAGKVEETPERLHNVIIVSYELRNAQDPDASLKIKQKEVYDEQKELLLMGERLVLVTLGFNLTVSHPYKPLIDVIKRLTLPPTVSRSQLAQIAWNFINDGLQTLLCLQFTPSHVAAGALFLASKFLRIKIGDWKEFLSKEFDIDLQQLKNVSNQILQSYESHAESSADALKANKLVRIGENFEQRVPNEACTDREVVESLKCSRDSEKHTSERRVKVEEEIELNMSQKTRTGRFDIDNTTCNTGQSDVTDEKEVQVPEKSYSRDDDWEFRGQCREEYDRNRGHFSAMEDEMDGQSIKNFRTHCRERKLRRLERHRSPMEGQIDSVLIGSNRYNPCVRISSRNWGVRHVSHRQEPPVRLFDSKNDLRKGVTRREFLTRLRNKKMSIKGSTGTSECLNVRLQNRLKLLRQKDEMLKKHCSWDARDYHMKRLH
ncbi:hypothetical protein KP509_14G079200 [Ceratopteris richardii]|uniref:Cyclin-like domain-containing protein n=1 Tax=Ceratopteris richardii TaxID=49495 RepID=A0A8T2TEN7_CERRI|nr:hypothetical protein KP509_14G079200 [Ceratopteris richardii]